MTWNLSYYIILVNDYSDACVNEALDAEGVCMVMEALCGVPIVQVS